MPDWYCVLGSGETTSRDVLNAQRLHWLELLWLNLFSYITLGIIGFNVVEIAVMNF